MKYTAVLLSILFLPSICTAAFIEYGFTQVFENGGMLEGSFTVDTSLDDGDNIWEGGLDYPTSEITEFSFVFSGSTSTSPFDGGYPTLPGNRPGPPDAGLRFLRYDPNAGNLLGDDPQEGISYMEGAIRGYFTGERTGVGTVGGVNRLGFTSSRDFPIVFEKDPNVSVVPEPNAAIVWLVLSAVGGLVLIRKYAK